MRTPLTTVSARPWRDSWLLPVLDGAGLLEPKDVPAMRATGAPTAWEACVAAGLTADEEIERAVSQRFRVPVARIESAGIGEAALLPGEVAVQWRVAPLGLEGPVLLLACSDPTDYELEQAVAFGAGRRVRLQIASPSTIRRLLVRFYPSAAVHLLAESAPPVKPPVVQERRPTTPGSESPRPPQPSPAPSPAIAGRVMPASATYEEFDAFVAALLAEQDLEEESSQSRRIRRRQLDPWAVTISPAHRPAAVATAAVPHCDLPDWL